MEVTTTSAESNNTGLSTDTNLYLASYNYSSFGIVFGIFFFLGMVTVVPNGVILALYICKKKMRKPRYLWYSSLAGSDFLVGFGLVLASFNNALGNKHHIALLFTVSMILSHSISLMTLVVLTVHRMILVMAPHKEPKYFSTKKVSLYILLIWLYNLLIYGIFVILEMYHLKIMMPVRTYI